MKNQDNQKKGGDRMLKRTLVVFALLVAVAVVIFAIPAKITVARNTTTTTTTVPTVGPYVQPTSAPVSPSPAAPVVSATQLGPINNGTCWPNTSFANANGQAAAVSFLQSSAGSGVAARYQSELEANTSWFGYTIGQSVDSWVGSLHWVQLTSNIVVGDTYCSPGSVIWWQNQTLQAGEWVAYNASGTPVIRVACGNLLLPPQEQQAPARQTTTVVGPPPPAQVVVFQTPAPAPAPVVTTVITCSNVGTVVGSGSVNQGGNCNIPPPPPPPPPVKPPCPCTPPPPPPPVKPPCPCTPPPPPPPPCTTVCTTPVQVQIPVQSQNPGVSVGPTPGASVTPPAPNPPAPTATTGTSLPPDTSGTGYKTGSSTGSNTAGGSASDSNGTTGGGPTPPSGPVGVIVSSDGNGTQSGLTGTTSTGGGTVPVPA